MSFSTALSKNEKNVRPVLVRGQQQKYNKEKKKNPSNEKKFNEMTMLVRFWFKNYSDSCILISIFFLQVYTRWQFIEQFIFKFQITRVKCFLFFIS